MSVSTGDPFWRTCAQVNLHAIRENLIQMKAHLPEETSLCAVVKANAYGHGAVPVAEAVADLVSFFAVATAEEAMELQDGGIRKPILVLGYVHESYAPELVRRKIRPCVFSYAQAEKLSRAALRQNTVLPVHLKVDTGMGRIGFPATEEGVKEAVKAASLPGIVTEGLFTHFAAADETDKTMTKEQTARYEFFASALKKEGVECPIHHVCNSAAILDLPGEGRQMARAGIAMYGCYPSEEVDREQVKLTAALCWMSHVVHVKWLEQGESVSYGATYTAPERRRIATVPVGYGDGYPRSLSNRGYVLIRGKKAPIRGRVCMDQMMVDVTDISAQEGDAVTLIGRDGEEEITAESLGALSGRFHYELLCDITPRVPRLYVD